MQSIITPGIKDKVPVLKDAFNILRNKSANWDDIGRELEVSTNDQEGLRKNMAYSDFARLEAVLSKWLEQGGATSTWGQLMEALKVLRYKDAAEEVEKFLRTIEAIKKYK